MPNFVADERILRIVKEFIVDVLALDQDPSEISSDASIIDDLGGDSLDLLELVFKLEEQFDIRIKRAEILKSAQGNLTDEEFAVNEVLTQAGLMQIRKIMPEVPEDRFSGEVRLGQIPTFFSPKTFARIVMEQEAKKT